MWAIGLAKIQEEKYVDLHNFENTYSASTLGGLLATSMPHPLNSNKNPILTKLQQTLPIKLLTPIELPNVRDKGLSYLCDEKFFFMITKT